MHEEVNKVSMLCVILIALAVVISLGYTVFASAKEVSNNTVSQTEATLTTIAQEDLERYEKKEVSGIEVLKAYYTFQGQSLAILIHNASMEHGLKTYITEDNDPKTFDPAPYAVELERVKVVNGLETIEKIQCLNYNALLASTEQGNKPTELAKTGVLVEGGSKGILSLVKGIGYNANYSFAINMDVNAESKGQIIKNLGISGLQSERTCEYVPLGAKYDASLIKASDGSVIGIVFIQKEK